MHLDLTVPSILSQGKTGCEPLSPTECRLLLCSFARLAISRE